jgi:hypothetical protein
LIDNHNFVYQGQPEPYGGKEAASAQPAHDEQKTDVEDAVQRHHFKSKHFFVHS